MRRPGWREPVGFAHRGGAREAPENTWTAFEHAVELGYRHLETDVHLSSDGHVLAYHDPTLERTTGEKGRISERSLEQLIALSAADGREIPQMRDLLRRWPAVHWNIDAKSDQVVKPLIALLKEERAGSRVIVASFSDRRLDEVRCAGVPGLSTACGPRQVAALRLAASSPPLVPLLRRRWRGPQALQIPPRWGSLGLACQSVVRLAHAEGLAVHVWTIDNEQEMNSLLDLGVDGIMTDRPALLRSVLESRGAWPPDGA